ncbi:UDP-glucose 4-epimerase [uncultured Candidatus Thioglobus sp.]|nr:UDP-glucose 4-epimerase [uncultured Candidatus Thioglobus sp.]
MNSIALITGGAGYIGSHVALALHDAGWQVIILDDLSTGSRAGVIAEAIFYQGEIGDKALLNSIFSKHPITIVLHLAAMTSVPESVENPQRCDKINRQDAMILIDTVYKNNIPFFIFSSTAGVYDENTTSPFSEDAPLQPISPYAQTKLATEYYLAESMLKHVILRYFNVGGVDAKKRVGNYKKNDTTLIKSTLECASGKRPSLKIFGTDYPTTDGSCVRDYIHVSDIATAHVLALNYLQDGGKSDVFNLGLGHGFSVQEVIVAAKKVTGVDFLTQEVPRREGDLVAIYSNPKKAQQVLGFIPKVQTLEQIIADAWAWEKHIQ